MKKYALLIVVFAVLLGGFVWLQSSPRQSPEGNGQSMEHGSETLHTITLPEERFSFTYTAGEQGYHLEEHIGPSETNAKRLHHIILTPTADYEDQKSRIGGEGSPAWDLAIYSNDLKQSPSMWASANPNASNIKLALSAPTETVVAGANGISYTIDGLYRNKVLVFASGSAMFVVHGAYLEETSPTFVDFPAWIESFTLEPLSRGAPQGKIDPRVACESALSYMTFPSGKEADAFVASCVAGNHPEVIERYIRDTGLDEATI